MRRGRDEIKTIVVPFRGTMAKNKDLTLGEYYIPHEFFWTFSNLKYPLREHIMRHEFLHIIPRGSPFWEGIKERSICGLPVEKWVMEELEGLVTIGTMLEALNRSAMYDLEASIKLLTLTPLKKTPLVRGVSVFLKFMEEKATPIETLQIILEGLQHWSCFVIDTKGNTIVRPALVFLMIVSKLKEKNPEKINFDIISEVANEAFKENHWIEGNPRLTRTTFSLAWASVLDTEAEKDRETAKIALRNFLEVAFWVPICNFFVIDTSSFIAKKIRIIDTIFIMKIKQMSGNPSTSLGQFVYDFTKRVMASAGQMRIDVLGEERFLLNDLPKAASNYIQTLVDDFKAKDSRIIPKDDWKALTKGTPLRYVTDIPINEFMNNYEQKRFVNIMKELIVEAIYYPEDCIDIVEEKAREVYNQLTEQEKEELFQSTQN